MRWHANWNNIVIQAVAIKFGVDVAAVAIQYKQPMRANGAILRMLIK